VEEEEDDDDDDDDDDDNDDNDDDDKTTATQALNTAQLLLFRKGQKLHDILLADSPFNDYHHLITKQSNTSEMFNILSELSKDNAIKVVNKKSAKNRINQWKRQESQCKKFIIAAESFNLLHLMLLVQIYDDLIMLGEKLSSNPKSNVKNVKS